MGLVGAWQGREIITATITLHIAGLAAVAYYLFSANIAFAAGGFILIALSDGILVLEHSEVNEGLPTLKGGASSR